MEVDPTTSHMMVGANLIGRNLSGFNRRALNVAGASYDETTIWPPMFLEKVDPTRQPVKRESKVAVDLETALTDLRSEGSTVSVFFAKDADFTGIEIHRKGWKPVIFIDEFERTWKVSLLVFHKTGVYTSPPSVFAKPEQLLSQHIKTLLNSGALTDLAITNWEKMHSLSKLDALICRRRGTLLLEPHFSG